MKVQLLNLLKFICCGMAFLLLYPFVSLYLGLFSYRFSDGYSLLHLGMVTASGYLGCLLSYLCRKREQAHPKQTKLLRIALAVFLCAVLVSFFVIDAWGVRIGLALTAGAACYMGALFYFQRYSEILTQRRMAILFGVAIFVVFLMWVAERPCPTSWMAFVFLISIGVRILAQNQANIDYLMERRKHKLEFLPPKIRRYNVQLICLILGVVVAGFFLRGPLSQALMAGVKGIGWGILYFFLWLQDMSSEGQSGTLPEQNSSSPMEREGAAGNPIFDAILISAAIAVVVWLLIHYRKQIVHAFSLFVYRLRELLQSLFSGRLFQRQRKQESEYYYDKEELLSPEETKRERKALRPASARQWKKQYKQFLNMPDGAEKYRKGYQLALVWLKLKGVSLERFYTANEIYETTKEQVASSGYGVATLAYNQIRYGEQDSTAQNLQSLCDTLRTMAMEL